MCRLASSSERSVATSRRLARRGRRASGVLVPGAGERGDVGAAAVSVRGEHRADAAGGRVDVGADDDPVRVDAAQHRLLGPPRQALDRDPQAAGRVSRAAAHRENGAPDGAGRQRAPRRGKRILQVPRRRLRRRRPRVPGDRPRARARRARPRGDGRDVGALARGGRGRGARVHGRRGVRDLPASPARRRRGPSAADAALALLPMLEPERFDVVVSDILTLAPALAAERAGLRRATLIPHVYPVHEEGLPFFAVRRAGAADAGRAHALAPGAAGAARRARAGARGAQPLARGRRACRRSSASTAGSRSSLALVATFPQLEYPRRWPARGAGDRADDASSSPIPRSGCRPAAGPWWWSRRSTAQDPDGRLRQPAARGARRRAGPGPGDDQPARRAAPGGPGERGRRRLAQLLPGDGGRRPRRLPRRSRDRRSGARRRRSGALLPGGRRHGRERRPGGLVGTQG